MDNPQAQGSLVHRLEVASKIAALLTFSGGVLFYVAERTLPVRLSVSPPSVVEFRCQVATFKFEECFRDRVGEVRNLSMSAALMLTANGPSAQGISIDSVEATVSFPWDDEGSFVSDTKQRKELKLSAFWSGDLTGGAGNFQQVVAESLSGGQSIRREYWMMPMPGAECAVADGAKSNYCEVERTNFTPWFRFLENAYSAVHDAPKREPPRIDISIIVKGKPSGWWSEQEIPLSCTVYLGRSALIALRDPSTNEQGEPGWVTLPCRI